jgi:choline kinase
MYLVVLAAGDNPRLRPLNEDRPAALVPFQGRPLLEKTLSAATSCGLADVLVVGGYRYEAFSGHEAHLLKNPDYITSGPVGTLMIADGVFGDAFVASDGDIAYKPEVLQALLTSPAEIAVVVDLDWQQYWERRFGEDLSDARSLRMTPDGTIRSIGQTINRIEDAQGQYIGLVVFRGRGVKALRRAWQRARDDAAYRRPILGHVNAMAKLKIGDVLDELVSGDVPIKAVPVHGGWVEIDTPSDVAAAEERWNSAGSPVSTADAAGAAAVTGAGSAAGPAPANAPQAPAASPSPARPEFELPQIFRAPRR